jgi:hypothetical protein
MKKVEASEIVSNKEYLKTREGRRKEIISLKSRRRISIGPRISLTFENRDTVIYQIQEMMRVENIIDQQKIQDEIDVYNDLIPEKHCLSATLFIEISDNSQVKEILDKMQGLDAQGMMFLNVGSEKIAAQFEPGHSKEDRISAVHYVRFCFTPDQAKRFIESQIEIHVLHPQYKASTALTSEQKRELARDLGAY